MVRGTNTSAKAAITDKEIRASLTAQRIMQNEAGVATPSPAAGATPRFRMFGGRAARAAPAPASPSTSGHAAALADITTRLEMLREEDEEEASRSALAASSASSRRASDADDSLLPSEAAIKSVREAPAAAAAEILKCRATERRLRRRMGTYEEAVVTLKHELQLAEENRHAMVDRMMQLGDEAMAREDLLSRAKRVAGKASEEAVTLRTERDVAQDALAKAKAEAEAASVAFKTTMGAQQSHVEELTKGLSRSQEEFSKASKRGMALAQRLDRSGAQTRKQQQELRKMGLLVSELNAAILTASNVMQACDMEVPAIVARRAALAVRQDGTIASPAQMPSVSSGRSRGGDSGGLRSPLGFKVAPTPVATPGRSEPAEAAEEREQATEEAAPEAAAVPVAAAAPASQAPSETASVPESDAASPPESPGAASERPPPLEDAAESQVSHD
jgi:hypothetical protein